VNNPAWRPELLGDIVADRLRALLASLEGAQVRPRNLLEGGIEFLSGYRQLAIERMDALREGELDRRVFKALMETARLPEVISNLGNQFNTPMQTGIADLFLALARNTFLHLLVREEDLPEGNEFEEPLAMIRQALLQTRSRITLERPSARLINPAELLALARIFSLQEKKRLAARFKDLANELSR
jgi:hypothetical protein